MIELEGIIIIVINIQNTTGNPKGIIETTNSMVHIGTPAKATEEKNSLPEIWNQLCRSMTTSKKQLPHRRSDDRNRTLK